MPIMGFSEQKHIPLILNGAKRQTTRKPRKKQVNVGDILYCYFKPRMKSGSCDNCILIDKCSNGYHVTGFSGCRRWDNKFGEAKVIGIRRVGSENTACFSEWMGDSLNRWAINDGFENFHEADEWFRRVHGDNWQNQEWDIIYFDGDWLREEK